MDKTVIENLNDWQLAELIYREFVVNSNANLTTTQLVAVTVAIRRLKDHAMVAPCAR